MADTNTNCTTIYKEWEKKKSDKAIDDAHKILYPDLPMIWGAQAFCP